MPSELAPSSRTEHDARELARNQSLTETSNDERFILELEFINALANPRYLHKLARDGILNSPAFVRYLAYLAYWEEPRYAKYVLYPHALRFRRELLREEFRSALENPRTGERAFASQYNHWLTFRANQIASKAIEKK